MKKIKPIFAALFLLALTACNTEPKTPTENSGEQAPTETAAKPTEAELEDMKKNDVKAFNRTKYDKIVTGLQSPESVITDGQFFYVSNVGPELAPSAKDANGFISKLDAEGNMIELKWLAGADLHAPKGMAIVKGVLYVADIDKVRGYNLKTKEKVYQLDFYNTGTQFLNDLTAIDDNTLYVSATDVGYVYKVDLRGSGKYEMMDILSDLTGVNGLYYDKAKKRLLLCSFGVDGSPVGMVGSCPLDAKPLKQKYMGVFKGFLDGIQLVADDMVLVTDWQDMEKGGNLIFYDLVTEEVRSVLYGLIGGPADFYYDDKTKKVWLPAMQDNELIITKLDLNLVRPDQGTLIQSSGGYEVRTKDKIEFPDPKAKPKQ
jgi:Prokaryotic membrane lipoprotein lipid attachment site